MQIDKAELADCFTPSCALNYILNQIDVLKPPVDIERIAKSLGIIEIIKLLTDSFEGCLVTDDYKQEGFIIIRDNVSFGRKRFTIGHELGHFVLPRHSTKYLCKEESLGFVAKSSDMVALMENEANEVAAGLLMPTHLYIEDMEKLGVPSLEGIRTLAYRYLVSFSAALHRFIALTQVPATLVFSRDGRILYTLKSNSFPFWLRSLSGGYLPDGSVSRSVRFQPGLRTEPKIVDPQIWLDNSLGRQFPDSILEQTEQTISKFQITLLTV